MKLAFLSPFYPFRGGIAQFSDSLFISLAKKNEVKAFTFTRQYPELLFPGKTQYVSQNDLNRNIPVVKSLDSINPFSYYKTAKEIIKFQPDVLLISYWMPFFAPALGKVSALVGKKDIKVIGILHNVIAHEKRFGDTTLTKYFLNRADGFVILNKASEKELIELKPNAKFLIQPHPLYDHYGEKINPAEARKRLNIPADKKVILFFGFIRDYKGLDLLIESLKNLDESYLLLVAGEVYGDFKKYDEQIDKLDLRAKINLHVRYIPETEIPLFFSASDVCVLPYRSATQSGVIGMAYHFDLPVMATAAGGLAEMIENGKTGLIFEKANSSAISASLRKYFENSYKNSMSGYIKEYKQQYSWDSFSEKLTEFANDIVNS